MRIMHKQNVKAYRLVNLQHVDRHAFYLFVGGAGMKNRSSSKKTAVSGGQSCHMAEAGTQKRMPLTTSNHDEYEEIDY